MTTTSPPPATAAAQRQREPIIRAVSLSEELETPITPGFEALLPDERQTVGTGPPNQRYSS